jgi:hypothetical protein
VATLFIGGEVVLPVEFSFGSHANLYGVHGYVQPSLFSIRIK